MTSPPENGVLTLIIPTGWPQENNTCSWFLHDAAGRLLEQGQSEPAHWPGVGQTEQPLTCRLILGGGQVSAHLADLPPTRTARHPDILGVALEEALLDPVEETFFLAQDTPERRQTTVAVIARSRLSGIAERLAEMGFLLTSAWPMGLLLETGEYGVLAGEVCWRETDGSFFSESIREFEANGHTVTNACELATLLTRLPRQPGFLYGELAPPRASTRALPLILPIARLAGGALLIWAMLAGSHLIWLHRQAQALRNEIAQNFEYALPGAVMVDPVLQLTRRTQAVRRQQGLLVERDFLNLAAQLPPLLAPSPARINSLDYDGRALRAELALAQAEQAHLTQACHTHHTTSSLLCALQPLSGKKDQLVLTLTPKAEPQP